MEYFRQISSAFEKLCSAGKQLCFFWEYCRGHSIDIGYMHLVLKLQCPSLNNMSRYTETASDFVSVQNFIGQ